MKNKWIILLATMLMVLPLGGRLSAQAPLISYECELLPVKAHIFSASAKTFTFGNYSTGDDISPAWLKSNGSYGELPNATYGNIPPSVTGNIALPGDGFYFGERKAKYFGITGGGLVYFGETDELHPTYNPYAVLTTFSGTETMKDIAFVRFYDNKTTNPNPTVFCKAENTSVQYEIVADTLFIAYNNVKVFDETFSFQYAFTKNGDVSFIPVDIRPQKACKFACGLYREPASKTSFSGCFLDDFEGALSTYSFAQIAINNTKYPNQTYRFHGPEPCVAVENPTVEWDYVAGTDYIALGNNKMSCNGNACLFILSEKSSLSGAELPQDGKVYKTGDKIGSNSNLVFVGNAAYTDKLYFSGNCTAENLKPATTYYIHAFPYNTDCAGVRYNTTNIPKRVVSTALKPINSISVDATTIADNGFTLNINKGDAERYILAVSRRQINPFATLVFPYKEGGYQAGDRVKFRYKSAEFDETYDLEILTAEGTAAQYQVTDAEPNTDYYYYIWSTDAAQQKFSLERRACGVSTLYRTTAVFAFDSAAPDQGLVKTMTPAGWELPNSNEKGFFVFDQGGDRFLNAELYPPEGGKFRRSAITPTMQGGKSVSVSVDFYFWYGGGAVPKNKKLRSGDTVYIEYKLVSDNKWTTLKSLTSANTKEGDYTVATDRFFPRENFNLRITGISTVELEQNEEWAFVGIRRIEVRSECNAISSTPGVSQIMNDRVTLSWEDGNNTPQAASYHLRYRLSENDAWTSRIAKTRQYTFTGLHPNTLHNMEVAAVCAPGDTSTYESVSFTTLRGLPYELVPDASSGVTFKTGALPASGTASLTEPDAAKTVWAPMQKAGNIQGTGLTVDANLNNPLWLNLPVLSTGASRGEARFSLKLSAWSAADATQQATFGQNDTLWVLFSTDNNFNAASAKATINLSEVTPQGKTFNIDFDVETPYQYWAIYTNMETAGNVLFIDSLNIAWLEMNCNAVTNIRHSNIGYYSVDIMWNGEAQEYGIFYNDRKTDKWDSVYTYETTYTLDGLNSATNYQYYIVAYCDADRLKASERSRERYFQTEKICEVPTLEVVEGSETWQGVTLITHSNEQHRQFNFVPKPYPTVDYLFAKSSKDTTQITGLIYFLDTANGVTYEVRVRALCANDTSEWSEPKEFTLEPTPVCHNPSNLKASVNEVTKVATLSWTAGTNNESYAIFIRPGRGRQDTIYTGRTSLNTKVEADVVYTWSVMAVCDALYSDMVRGSSFGIGNVGVESTQSFDKAVKVRVSENQIIIENNEGRYIKSLQAFSVDGKLLRTYSVNSTQNAYIYHTLPKGAALLRVLGENGKTATYKTVIL